MEKLPMEYFLEVYEDSFTNDPSFHLESSSPLPSLTVGDYFNHRLIETWHTQPKTETEAFKIKELDHIFWVIEGSHIGYKLMVCLEIVPREW